MEDDSPDGLELPTLYVVRHAKDPFPGARSISRWSALRAASTLGPMLYAIQFPDGTIKIGCTTLLHRRISDIACRFGVAASDVRIMAIKPGDLADEGAIHSLLSPHRAHGHEYYHPTAEVMAVVNEWRGALGREAIAAR